ncbi:MAG: long-chain fatty acid--CoA ligase, partial [Acidimicrobiia bacterium]|nr:long-chain fatty acid--CoA ligase [Acidimicrobiia bacterium]
MAMTIAEATAVLTAPGQIFEVVDETVRGVPMKVWKNAPPSLRTVLEMSRGHGDKTFLVYEDERWSFADVMRHVDALGSLLVDRYGVAKGD